MAKKATHSLSTEIKMLMDTASVEDAVLDIDKLNTHFAKLRESAEVTQQALDKVRKANLSDIINQLQNLDIRGGEVTANEDIKKALETKIRTAIMKSTITLTPTTEGRDSLVINLDDKFWDKNMKKVKEAMGEALSRTVVNFDDIPGLDMAGVIEQFNETFNEQWVNYIEQEDLFGLYRTIQKGKRKGEVVPKYANLFRIGEESIRMIMGSIEDNFVSFLEKPENITIENIPKFNIDSSKIQDIVGAIEESIGDIDKYITVDADLLKDLPNIHEKISHFKDNLTKLLKDMHNLANQLDSLQIGKATQEDVKNTLEILEVLKGQLTAKVGSWVESIMVELQKEMDKPPNLDDVKKSVLDINTKLDELTSQKMDKLREELESITFKKTSAKDKSNVGKQIDEALKDTLIIALTNQIIDQLGTLKLDKLDTKRIEEKINSWVVSYDLDLVESLHEVLEVTYNNLTGIIDIVDEGFQNVTNKGLIAFKNLSDRINIVDDSPKKGGKGIANEDFSLEFQTVTEELTKSIRTIGKGYKQIAKEMASLEKVIQKELAKVKNEVDKVSIDKKVISKPIKDTNRNLVELGDWFSDIWTLTNYSMVEAANTAQKANDMYSALAVFYSWMGELTRRLEIISNEISSGTLEVDDLESLNDVIQNGVTTMFETYLSNIQQVVSQFQIHGAHKKMLKGVFTKLTNLMVSELRDKITEVEFNHSEPLEVNIDDAIRKLIPRMQKYMRDVKLTISDELIEPDIKVDGLYKNIDKYIQRIITRKGTAISRKKIDTVTVPSEIELLQEKVGEHIKKAIKEYDVALKQSVDKKFSAKGMGYIFDRVVSVFNNAFYQYAEQVSSSFEMMSASDFSIRTRDLDKVVRFQMAQRRGLTSSEFSKQVPLLKGPEAHREIMRTNVSVITDTVNRFITTNIKTLLNGYRESIRDTEILPDTSTIQYVYDEIKKFQDTIIKKVKDMVRDQFRFLTEEIKEMNIQAKSLGYRPTQAFDREVAKANPAVMTDIGVRAGDIKEYIKTAAKSGNINIDHMSVGNPTMKVEGLTDLSANDIRINSTQNLVTEVPQVVVNGKLVDLNTKDFNMDAFMSPLESYLEKLPFHAESPHLLMGRKSLTAEDFLKGSKYTNDYDPFNLNGVLKEFEQQAKSKHSMGRIFENMARYFFVGYAMQLPIKAITSANKVAAELDYRIAKARENILIKDPNMMGTARNVVYERYKNQGMDVGSDVFQADVRTEATRLRNMMAGEMQDYLINIAKAYDQDIGKVGQYYEIASRSSSDPYETLTKTREIAKILAAEVDMDSDFAGKGMEALMKQWGFGAGELSRHTNMLLKTAMLSNVTVTDLLATTRDTAAQFRGKLDGEDVERDFAAAMALSAMFVESTGKSGREAGTFWKNVVPRLYVKDSLKYLEGASGFIGMEGLDPYYRDEQGVMRKRDFIDLFSEVLETSIKSDGKGQSSMMSEIFPIRTIGGAEAITTLLDDMRSDLEKTVQQLKEIGEIDIDATLDDLSIKDVIEKYIDNIMDVTNEDIAGYIAGIQGTQKHTWQRVVTQWEATTYSVFSEMKEEFSLAATYVRHVLSIFERHGDKLSEVLKLFGNVGLAMAVNTAKQKIQDRIQGKPLTATELQKRMAIDYQTLSTAEIASRNRLNALTHTYGSLEGQRDAVTERLRGLRERRDELEKFIADNNKLPLPPKGVMKKDIDPSIYSSATERGRAQRVKQQIESEIKTVEGELARLDGSIKYYKDSMDEVADATQRQAQLIDFIMDGLGSRDITTLQKNYGDMFRNEHAYNEVAKFAIESKFNVRDEEYSKLYNRMREIEKDRSDLHSRRVELHSSMRDNTDFIFSNEANKNKNRVRVQDAKKQNRELSKELTDINVKFMKLGKELDLVNAELNELHSDKLQAEGLIHEATRPHLTMEGEIPKSTREITDLYRKLLPSAGVSTADFESGMDKLSKMFIDGTIGVDGYESSLKDVSRQLGISDRDFGKFKEMITLINAEVRLGTVAIAEYIAALNTAKGAGLPNTSKVVNAVTEGAEIPVNESLGSKGKSGGIVRTVLNALGIGAIGSKVVGGTKGAGLFAGVKSAFSGVVGSGGIEAGLTATGKFVLPIAATMVALKAGGSVIGGWTERSMDESDRLLTQADKLESQIKKQMAWRVQEDDGFMATLGKSVIGGFSYFGSLFASTINNLAGGTAPSFKEMIKLDMDMRKSENSRLTNRELTQKLLEEYGVIEKRFESQLLRQDELDSKNPFVTSTGEPRYEEGKGTLPLEELMEFMERELSRLNESIGRNDAEFAGFRLKQMIAGISENSQSMRDAIIANADKNITELEKIVESFKSYIELLDPASQSYRAMALQILDLENKIDENELKKIQAEFSEYDELMEKFNRQTTNLQARYDIKKYDALLTGIKEDSGAIRQIESKLAEAQVSAINTVQSQLRGLADHFKDQPDRYNKIMDQMLALDVEKRKLLYDIREKLPGSISTFNLPSDIQPITYFEAMTRRNTHKNMTVRAGDNIVNLNIANMSGTEEDINKISNAVAKAMNNFQRGFVRQFANDVKTGMGNNYYSWNTY